MKAIIFFLVAALTCTVSLAQNSSGPLNFLEMDKDYVIQFREGTNLFRQSHVDESADGTGKVVDDPIPVFHVVKVSNGSWALLEYPADPADYVKWNAKREEASQFTKERMGIAKEKSKRGVMIHELENEIKALLKSGTPSSTDKKNVMRLEEKANELKAEREGSTKALNAISERHAEFHKELALEVRTEKMWVNLEHAVSITEPFTKGKIVNTGEMKIVPIVRQMDTK